MWCFCEKHREALSNESIGEWALQASWGVEYRAEDGGGQSQGPGEFEAVPISEGIKIIATVRGQT